MAIVQIDLQQGEPFFKQRTVLDGREYVLDFKWNQRAAKWYLSLFDQDEDVIVSGLKVVCNFPLLTVVTDERKPPGFLFAVDTSGQEKDPGIDDFGIRVLLLYIETTT